MRGYEIVVGLCTDDDSATFGEYNLDEHQADTNNSPPFAKQLAPDNARVLLDVQSTSWDSQGDLSLTEDFSDWARVMLEKAADPDNAPDVYDAVNITQTAGWSIGLFVAE